MKKILEVMNLARSAENFIGSQFLYLSEYGNYEMHLVCSDGENLPMLKQKYGVKYKAIPINRNITPIQDFKSLINICKYIKDNNIDIIIGHQEKGNLLGHLAGFIMGVPIRIYLAHGVMYESMTGFKRWAIKTQDVIVAKLATNVICVSNFVRNTRIKDGLDKPHKSVVIGHGSCCGIDVVNKFNPGLYNENLKSELRKQYGISDTDFVIGFCGRLVKDKGVEELTASYKILESRYPEKTIKLFVIGVLEKRDAISETTSEYLQNHPNIIFTGRIPYSEIQKYYLPMDVLVLPSHRDGLGLAPLEAQAMGVPAIVTDFTGCAETIRDGITGEYIDLNPSNIAEVISHFFDKEKSITYGKNGRDFVYNYFNKVIFNKNILDYIDSLWKTK